MLQVRKSLFPCLDNDIQLSFGKPVDAAGRVFNSD